MNEKNNLRERLYRARMDLNFYGGISLGLIAPIAAIRYGLDPLPYNNTGSYTLDTILETANWTVSAVASLPMQIISIPTGVALGAVSCLQLAKNRNNKNLI